MVGVDRPPGRVVLLGNGATPLGEVLAGPLAAHFGARATVLGAGVLGVLVVGAALAVREVRDLPNTALTA